MKRNKFNLIKSKSNNSIEVTDEIIFNCRCTKSFKKLLKLNKTIQRKSTLQNLLK